MIFLISMTIKRGGIMSITKQTLMMKMLYLPLVLMICSIASIIIFWPNMYISTQQVAYFRLVPIAIVIASIICFFQAMIRYNYGKALLKNDIRTEIIRGKVTQIKKSSFAPKIYFDGQKYVGKFITMDEIKYYMFVNDKIEYNSHIWVKIIRGSRLVIEWDFYLKSESN